VQIALLTIGTELTRGELQNTNSTWLAERLAERGYEVTTMLTIDDDAARIERALLDLAQHHAAVLCTGGLGPTTDDLTTSCAARAAGVELVRDAASLEHIAALHRAHGIAMPASNEKQAYFPAGSVVIKNSVGTAPGFHLQLAQCQMFFMPGVPGEMRSMFEDHVLSHLRPPVRRVKTARLMSFGMPEAEVNDRLDGIEQEHGITLGYRASKSQIEVKVLTEVRAGETDLDAEARSASVLSAIEERLGEAAYARGRTTLAEALGRQLLTSGKTLGLAESCTGGLVSEMITQVPGASAYYRGGICSYHNEVKESVLGVEREILTLHGAVSEQVVAQMARGARRVLGCDLAIAYSGIAGPGGGTADKPVGLVHWAIATKEATQTHDRVFRGSRATIQHRAALYGLWTALKTLQAETKDRSASIS
jgi:nicotinamide-nucleotide amidase